MLIILIVLWSFSSLFTLVVEAQHKLYAPAVSFIGGEFILFHKNHSVIIQVVYYTIK